MTHNDQNTVFDTLARPLRVLRLSLTDRCQFNCTYCMPQKNPDFLPKKDILTFEEIITIVSILKEFGVKKIKITGGEPTLRKGLDILIRKLKELEGIDDIGLITNGVLLKKLANPLYEAGLRRINVSLDAIDPRVFQTIIGTSYDIRTVLEGIDHACALGFWPVKINCVVRKGVNENQVIPLAAYCKERGLYLRLIEFMDVGSIDWVRSMVVPSHELLRKLQKHYRLDPVEPSYKGEVAQRYRYADGPGEIGFISSVTQPFCRDCDRLRLTADGTLYGCLFAAKGKNLKPYLASSDELRSHLKKFWLHREDRYSEIRATESPGTVKESMNVMGG